MITPSCWASSIRQPPGQFHANFNDNLLPTSPTLLIPEIAHDVLVVAWVACELALEEGHVDQGRVEVDELEDEHFERQVVVELRLGPMHLWRKRLK